MRSLLGLNFGMWMSLNEVVNDNGMQRVGRETNIAQGQYCNIALGQYWFPFALDWNAQIQIHKYKYTNTNTQIQKHKNTIHENHHWTNFNIILIGTIITIIFIFFSQGWLRVMDSVFSWQSSSSLGRWLGWESFFVRFLWFGFISGVGKPFMIWSRFGNHWCWSYSSF